MPKLHAFIQHEVADYDTAKNFLESVSISKGVYSAVWKDYTISSTDFEGLNGFMVFLDEIGAESLSTGLYSVHIHMSEAGSCFVSEPTIAELREVDEYGTVEEVKALDAAVANYEGLYEYLDIHRSYTVSVAEATDSLTAESVLKHLYYKNYKGVN